MSEDPTHASRYCSFIVRFWYEPADRRWYGEVEHVQSRAAQPVTSLATVQQFMQQHSGTVLHQLQRSPTPETD